MNTCLRCGYTRKMLRKVDWAGCPRCGYKPPTLGERLNRAWLAFNEKPSVYKPRKGAPDRAWIQ
jgi:hypothetical protein